VPLQKLKLGLQGVDIGDDRIVAGRALRPAGAEPAQSTTEGDVQIQRNFAILGHGLDPVGEFARPDAAREMRGGRVGCVAGHACVEKPKAGELRVVFHPAKLGKEKWGLLDSDQQTGIILMHDHSVHVQCGDCPIRHRAVCARCETDELARLEQIKYYRSFQAGSDDHLVG
jgi:hypothetical protein